MNDRRIEKQKSSLERKAEVPSNDSLLELVEVPSPHPSTLPIDQLLRDCDFRTQSRGGPGGQHRNRTASGVFVTHLPTDTHAEATEQRDQHRNRVIAVRRLRLVLAIAIRTPSPMANDAPELHELEIQIREIHRGGSLKMAEDNDAKPAVIAMLLNDLHVAGGQPSLVAPTWKVSTSRIVALVKSHPPALTLVNKIRHHHGRLPLH